MSDFEVQVGANKLVVNGSDLMLKRIRRIERSGLDYSIHFTDDDPGTGDWIIEDSTVAQNIGQFRTETLAISFMAGLAYMAPGLNGDGNMDRFKLIPPAGKPAV